MKKIDVSSKVLEQIEAENLRPKPKWIFWLSSGLMALGFGALVFVLGFLVNLLIFKFQYSAIVDCQCSIHGVNAAIWDCFRRDFPWGILVVAGLLLILGIWLFRRFDFAYRYRWWVYVSAEVILVAVLALVLNMAGVNYYSQPVMPDLYCKTTGYGCCDKDKNGQATCETRKENEATQIKETTQEYCSGGKKQGEKAE